MSKIVTQKDIIQRFKDKHGDRYDYSLVRYDKMRNKVFIVCKEHGIKFEQSPDKHLESKIGGCPTCQPIGKGKNINNFIDKAKDIHGDRYVYTIVNYKKVSDKISIICKKHGVYKISANSHLNGRGCSKCSGNKKMTKDEFVEIANFKHISKYSYDKCELLNLKSNVIITCDMHGDFVQLPYNHLRGFGCQLCSNKSNGEYKIAEILTHLSVHFIRQHSFKDCRYKNPLPFDFYLPKLNILIEFDGIQHFEVVDWFGGIDFLLLQQKKDTIKDNWCISNSIRLYRISYLELISDDKIKNIIYEITK